VSYTKVASSAVCRDHVPLLADVAAGVTGGAQLRNRGTYAGSACYANPSSDAPAVPMTLDARLRVHGRSGRRDVAAVECFHDAFVTALAPDDEVTVAGRCVRDGFVSIGLGRCTATVTPAA
jgi:CO/xanthine dehydrogenase FAD-binding subunit